MTLKNMTSSKIWNLVSQSITYFFVSKLYITLRIQKSPMKVHSFDKHLKAPDGHHYGRKWMKCLRSKMAEKKSTRSMTTTAISSKKRGSPSLYFYSRRSSAWITKNILRLQFPLDMRYVLNFFNKCPIPFKFLFF